MKRIISVLVAIYVAVATFAQDKGMAANMPANVVYFEQNYFWCHSEFSVHYIEFLSAFSVHHLHNLAYLFIVLGFTLGFISSYCHPNALPFFPNNQ